MGILLIVTFVGYSLTSKYYISLLLYDYLSGTSTWRDEADSGRSAASSSAAADQADSMAYRSRNPSASAAAKSSFQNAVYIYSGKLAPSASPKQQRPSSAVSATRTRESITLMPVLF